MGWLLSPTTCSPPSFGRVTHNLHGLEPTRSILNNHTRVPE